MRYILILVFILVIGIHDHSDHISKEDALSEAERLSTMSLDELMDEISGAKIKL